MAKQVLFFTDVNARSAIYIKSMVKSNLDIELSIADFDNYGKCSFYISPRLPEMIKDVVNGFIKGVIAVLKSQGNY